MSEDKRCLVCGKAITALNGSKISEGRYICLDCNHYTGVLIFRKLRSMSDNEIIEAVTTRRGGRFKGKPAGSSMKDKLSAANKRMGSAEGEETEGKEEDESLITVNGILGECLSVNRAQRVFSFLPVRIKANEIPVESVHDFSDIRSFELVEDTTPGKKKGLCRSMKVRIGLEGEGERDIYIHILNNAKVYTDSDKYIRARKTAQKICLLLKSMVEEEGVNAAEPKKNPLPDSAPKANVTEEIPDMLREYKKLFDEGVITQEEFEAKKAQLLGL